MMTPSSVDGFKLVLLFLKRCERRKTVSKLSSYVWKHRVEEWGRKQGEDAYVSSGIFIAATLAEGIPIQRFEDSLNCAVRPWRGNTMKSS
jgi:hypothetical protein